MIVGISDKHAMLSLIDQFAVQLLSIVNDFYLSKHAERIKEQGILLEKLPDGWLFIGFCCHIFIFVAVSAHSAHSPCPSSLCLPMSLPS